MRAACAPARGARAMVTAPHAAAAEAGARVLHDGGNAADAAVAAGAALAVVYPHMTGIGGDAFWLHYDAAAANVHAYNGSGAAAELADLEFYRAQGFSTIPITGPAAALTVPGAVDAWFALHDRFGSLEMSRLLAPAIALASDGVAIAKSVKRSLAEEKGRLRRDPGARAVFLGGATNGGRTLRQPALAKTLTMIARHGRGWFYAGEGAAAISAWAARAGSPLRAEDLAEHRGLDCAPIEASFAGLRSLTTPPNSQGVTLLFAQQVFEALTGESGIRHGTAGLVHAAVESSKAAYAERDRRVGDPATAGALLGPMLSSAYAAEVAASIRRGVASAGSAGGGGDTTYFACVDERGNAVSYIQSLYQHFGACVAVPQLGVVLQNRGIAFSLDEGHIRSLVPRRRPFHTLMPALLLRDRAVAAVYGSMGGDAQPQIALQLSIRLAKLRMDVQAAIDAPRWRWEGRDGVGRIVVEDRLGAACVRELSALGHEIVVLGPWEESMGHAGAIVVDAKRGELTGAADRRSDGAAVAL